MKVCWSFTL